MSNTFSPCLILFHFNILSPQVFEQSLFLFFPQVHQLYLVAGLPRRRQEGILLTDASVGRQKGYPSRNSLLQNVQLLIVFPPWPRLADPLRPPPTLARGPDARDAGRPHRRVLKGKGRGGRGSGQRAGAAARLQGRRSEGGCKLEV